MSIPGARTSIASNETIELIAELAPELLPDHYKRRYVLFPAGVVSAYAGLWSTYMLQQYGDVTSTIAYLTGTAALVAGVGLGELIYRDRRSRKVRDFAIAISSPTSDLHGAIIRALRMKIASRRQEALGARSKWTQVRQPLTEAKEEADRQVLYWTERLQQNPDFETARLEVVTARALSAKFERALTELGGRTDALRRFLDHCEAKISVLEAGKRDLEQSRRLAALSAQAPEMIDEASVVVNDLGTEFIGLAASISDVLQRLDREWLRESAAYLPLEQIEVVADQLVAASQDRERELQALTKRLS